MYRTVEFDLRPAFHKLSVTGKKKVCDLFTAAKPHEPLNISEVTGFIEKLQKYDSIVVMEELKNILTDFDNVKPVHPMLLQFEPEALCILQTPDNAVTKVANCYHPTTSKNSPETQKEP